MSKRFWSPSEDWVKESNMFGFMGFLKLKKGLDFKNYNELYQWSVNERENFWESLWEFGEVIFSEKYEKVLENGEDMLNSKWFVGAKLNFAENLLRFRNENPALIFHSEAGNRRPEILTYNELYNQTSKVSRGLREFGVRIGNRVFGVLPNMNESVVAMLATTSLGAIWSSCSPDFGFESMIERIEQIQPKILFISDGYFFNGKSFDFLETIPKILERVNSIKRVVVVPYVNHDLERTGNYVNYRELLEKESEDIKFERLPFDHPVYIVFTSGTTGKPKCLAHGAGGTLLQHFKELALHSNLKSADKLYYVTTCGWVLWNWMISALMIGCAIVLRDGSPFYPDAEILFELIEKEKITHFGTSARYIKSAEKLGLVPRDRFDLNNLKVLMYGGSPLFEEGFAYIYDSVKKDLMVSSMPGGTEIVSCFALANPLDDVWGGEAQGWGLGMKCEIFDEQGNSVKGKKGELVCTASFPSQPIYFWNDEEKIKYKESYFEYYPSVWRHGDYAEITEQGGVIVHGRSDATLNPGGVRIGAAEIYNQIEKINEIEDSIVVGKKFEGDERIILFVKLKENFQLDRDLTRKIKQTIIKNCTLNHVPAKIISVKDIPYTLNGKKVEIAVKKIVEGEEVSNLNALKNPESLEVYKNLEELKY